MNLHPVSTSAALEPLGAADKQRTVPRFISCFNKHSFPCSILAGDNLC